jgi:hypothetical protein
MPPSPPLAIKTAEIEAGSLLNRFDRPAGRRDMTKPEWQHLVAQFESHRNQPGGFWCVTASVEAADEAVTRSFPVDAVDCIVMMSDGVSCGIDDYGILPTWRQAIETARRNPAQLVQAVHEAEASDPNATRWQRTKPHDDKAIGVIQPASKRGDV